MTTPCSALRSFIFPSKPPPSPPSPPPLATRTLLKSLPLCLPILLVATEAEAVLPLSLVVLSLLSLLLRDARREVVCKVLKHLVPNSNEGAAFVDASAIMLHSSLFPLALLSRSPRDALLSSSFSFSLEKKEMDEGGSRCSFTGPTKPIADRICGMDERVFIRKIHPKKCFGECVRMLTHKAFGRTSTCVV